MNTKEINLQEAEQILQKYIETKTRNYDSIETRGIKIYKFKINNYDLLIDTGENYYNITIPSIHKVSEENYKKATKYLNDINAYSTCGSYDIDYETGQISLNYCLLYSGTPYEKIIEKTIDKMLKLIEAERRLTYTDGRKINIIDEFPYIKSLLKYPKKSNDIFPFN